MKQLTNILFWSVISAAFIGPGTVTTAASSGASYGYSLLWALLFSTLACLVLQEAGARLTIVSGRNLGQSISDRLKGKAHAVFIMLLVSGGIILGCAAYEAGNILGGAAGAVLGLALPAKVIALGIGCSAALLLYFASARQVAQFMGIAVAIMGVAFFITAIRLNPPVTEIIKAAVVPQFPKGSGLLVIGLIGTTVVPYNLFLGSGIAFKQNLRDMRIGLSTAILLGGLISMAVLVVGTSVTTEFSFEALSHSLRISLGDWANLFLGLGLFAAGFSSAITAPFAAAVTAKSIFGDSGKRDWTEQSTAYRSVWMLVLICGIVFGISDVRPIPAIILAQAMNGIILPFIAIFLLTGVNDRKLMGEKGLNGLVSNIFLWAVVFITILLGASNLLKAASRAFGFTGLSESSFLIFALIVTAILAIPMARSVLERRRRSD